MAYGIYRSGSVPPGVYRTASLNSSARSEFIKPSKRLPSYCAPQGQYYACTSYTLPASKPAVPIPRNRISVKPAHALSSTRFFDLGYPTRTFGSRLSKGYSAANITRPEIYEQAYGVSHLPGWGRDSYSAYKFADATIDDSDDLISISTKRDNQALRNVERTIANIGNPPSYQKTFVRASSVPPQLRYNTASPAHQTKKSSRTVVKSRPVRRAVNNDYYYQVSPPKVQCQYETVHRGSDLLNAKEKMCAREFVDLSSPSGTLALRMRIVGAQNTLAKHGALISRYAPTSEDTAVDAELRLMKTKRGFRAQSVQ